MLRLQGYNFCATAIVSHLLRLAVVAKWITVNLTGLHFQTVTTQIIYDYSYSYIYSADNIIHKQSDGSNSVLIFKGGNNERNKPEDILASKEIKTNKRRRKMKGQRAIGVVYNPAYEKYGNYVPTVLTKRYEEDKEELPETFPTGL